jgi:hypothetical protein
MKLSVNARAVLAAALLLMLPAAASATPLIISDVKAPDVNCVFNTTCRIVVNDTVGDIAVPGAVGKAFLQSRSFTGAAGAPAAGKTGYMYRIDLTQSAAVGNIVCITALKLNFGPVSKFHYKTGGPLADIFVVTTGGLGSVGLASADLTANVITFKFSAPVCPGASPGKGVTSFFFGLAAVKVPKAITAQVQAGNAFINVAARAPSH